MKALLLICWIVPAVMLLVGGILKKHPAADMRTQNGYNTSTSRKSQAHWDYAQAVAPDIFLTAGKRLAAVTLVYTLAALLLPLSPVLLCYIGAAIGLCFLLMAFLQTERQIKAHFPE